MVRCGRTVHTGPAPAPRPWAQISPYSQRPYCAGDLTPERCYAKACSTTSPTWALNHLGHHLDFSNSISGTHQKQTSKRMTKTTRTYYVPRAAAELPLRFIARWSARRICSISVLDHRSDVRKCHFSQRDHKLVVNSFSGLMSCCV